MKGRSCDCINLFTLSGTAFMLFSIKTQQTGGLLANADLISFVHPLLFICNFSQYDIYTV